MMKTKIREPLYRKVNSKARNCHHYSPESRWDRHTKNGISRSMHSNKRNGLDYTPLFRFLLSKVGKSWDDIYSEAKSRLHDSEPIFWMVGNDTSSDTFRGGKNSIYSRLIVIDGILQIKNKDISNEDFTPSCPCCTHTFNGKPLIRKYPNYPIHK